MRDPNSAFKTILFSGHDLRFIRPFMARCERDPRYRVLVDEHQGHEITDPDKCQQLLPAADVILCEWALGNAEWYSHHKSNHQVLIVRLHSQEMRLPFLDRIQWANVDALILICPRNRNLIHERYPSLKDKTRLVFNPIDCRALARPKLLGAEFNLGLLGLCPMLKAPHLAFEVFSRLKRADRRFTLHLKGKHPRDYDWLWRRPAERAYYERFFEALDQSPLADSVVFETYGDDVPLWFSKIGFVLSTSDFEGSHQSVAEGMASGAIPIIRNWAGADLIYPPKYVAATVEELAGAVLKWRTPDHYLSEAEFCRAFSQEHFDQEGICDQIEALCSSKPRPDTVVAVDFRPSPGPAPHPPVMILCYLPPGFRGGYRIRVEQEVKSLTKHGCMVHLVCLHPANAESAALSAHSAELNALGCPVHLVPVTDIFRVKLDETAVHETLEELQRVARANDLRIIHAEALYCARLGLLLKERCPSLRLVFDCHGASPEEERLSGAHPSRISAMEGWERRVLAGADLNVFVSGAMREFYLRRYGFAGLPHVVVPCCVTDERFPEESAPCPVPLPTQRPILAYLGTMAAWQCGEEMIRLFAQLSRHDPELFFLILAPEADHGRTRELMKKHGLPERYVCLTELPHEQVASVLQHAHAGVLLRRSHPVNQVSSPTKFGEYLAAGLPVIMTEGIGDFARMATEKGLGLVLSPALLDLDPCPPTETARIAGFVRESWKDGGRTAARCRDAARQCLGWHAAAAALLSTYCALDRVSPTAAVVRSGSATSPD